MLESFHCFGQFPFENRLYPFAVALVPERPGIAYKNRTGQKNSTTPTKIELQGRIYFLTIELPFSLDKVSFEIFIRAQLLHLF